jgi:hypothetical protein
MVLDTLAPVDADAAPESALLANLDRLWPALARLGRAGGWGEAPQRLGSYVAPLRFLLHAGAGRPLLAGLVGGASCGKSTLFDSLHGQKLSRIHYQPHSSLGPVAWLHGCHRPLTMPEGRPRRFLAEFEAAELRGSAESVTGAVDKVYLAFHRDDQWQHLIVLDLPDISSESARREGWLVQRILPWLDLVVWMVDPNDYLFEDLYLDLIDQVAALGQRSIVVVNDIHGQVEPRHPVLLDRVGRFRSDAWFLLPRLRCTLDDPYPLFRNEPSFLEFKEFLKRHRATRPVAPLVTRARQEAAAILHVNAEWTRLSHELSVALDRVVTRQRKGMLASAPLLSVLPGPAREELDRLRNRLSLWHHGKRLYQALRHPARVIGRRAVQQIQISEEQLDTEPLYRHLIGALKALGVELHRTYLESRLAQRLQECDSDFAVLGSFDAESLKFRAELDDLARHLFHGAQRLLSDPSLWKDKRFHFVVGTTGVALVFLMAEATIGLPGVSLLVGKGVTALVGVLSPELARYLPLDDMSRLAREARDMLAEILDRQIHSMIDFYLDPQGRYLEPHDELLAMLESLRSDATSGVGCGI